MSSPPRPRRAAARLAGVGSTIFAEMSALAVRTGSVNLGQGFPDVSGPDTVLRAAYDAMTAGRNQYPPGHGAPELVDAVRAHQRRHYGLDLAADEVVVTTGATEAIAAAMLGLVDPGDEVIVCEPYYDSYRAMIQFCGGVRRAITMRAPDYRLDLDRLQAAVTERTKVILLNSPHNPTGRVLDRDELEGVAAVARRHDLVVVTDEVYEHLVFDDHQHVPIATFPDMFERTLSISSSGKTFSLTGWKIGWATGPADLVGAVEGAKNWLSYSSGAPFQPAIAHALDHEEAFHEQLRADLAAKRDHLCTALADLGLEVHRPQGTYFVTTDVSELGWSDGREFCAMLAERARVVAIPSMVFYDEASSEAEGRHLVRWAFCKERDVIDEGISRLGAVDLRRRTTPAPRVRTARCP